MSRNYWILIILTVIIVGLIIFLQSDLYIDLAVNNELFPLNENYELKFLMVGLL